MPMLRLSKTSTVFDQAFSRTEILIVLVPTPHALDVTCSSYHAVSLHLGLLVCLASCTIKLRSYDSLTQIPSLRRCVCLGDVSVRAWTRMSSSSLTRSRQSTRVTTLMTPGSWGDPDFTILFQAFWASHACHLFHFSSATV